MIKKRMGRKVDGSGTKIRPHQGDVPSAINDMARCEYVVNYCLTILISCKLKLNNILLILFIKKNKSKVALPKLELDIRHFHLFISIEIIRDNLKDNIILTIWQFLLRNSPYYFRHGHFHPLFDFLFVSKERV